MFTEPLPTSGRRDTQTDIQTNGWGFMKYAAETGSGAVHIKFIKIGSGILKLIRRDSQTHRQHGYSISTVLFLHNKKVG
jgi:hypothetical protein